MTYNADYFIKFFEAIPDRKWCEGSFNNGKGQHCAGGLCGDMFYERTPKRALRLYIIFEEAFGFDVVDVNDLTFSCPTRFRKFKRPRTRILHALREAKAKGY